LLGYFLPVYLHCGIHRLVAATVLSPSSPTLLCLFCRFLKDVHWGACDYLVIDSPPGTSDEHISIVQVSGMSYDWAAAPACLCIPAQRAAAAAG